MGNGSIGCRCIAAVRTNFALDVDKSASIHRRMADCAAECFPPMRMGGAA